MSWSDPHLNQLVAVSHRQNLDAKQSYFRIIEARAVQRSLRSNFFPQADSVSGYSFNQTSQNDTSFALESAESFNLFTQGLNSSWQIDLFGQIRRSVEAAQAESLAAEFDSQAVWQLLMSDIAASYLRVRLLQEQVEIARQSIYVQRETLKLVTERRDAGVSTDLDQAQTESFVQRTEALIVSLQQQIDVEINAISVLVGETPSLSLREFLSQPSLLHEPSVPEAGFPANLIRNRPDVLRDEQLFASSLAQIGVAEAELYPQLTLTGNISVGANTISSLFESNSLAFNVGPSFQWNILNFGQIRANVEAERARAEQAQLTYQQTLLNAVREVEDSIAKYNGLKQQADILDRAIEADQRAVRLSLDRYRAGRANFQRVLNAQLQLLQDLQQRTQSRTDSVIELVRLYNALGGNWRGAVVAGNNPLANCNCAPGQQQLQPELLQQQPQFQSFPAGESINNQDYSQFVDQISQISSGAEPTPTHSRFKPIESVKPIEPIESVKPQGIISSITDANSTVTMGGNAKLRENLEAIARLQKRRAQMSNTANTSPSNRSDGREERVELGTSELTTNSDARIESQFFGKPLTTENQQPKQPSHSAALPTGEIR